MNSIVVSYDPFAMESRVTVIHGDFNEQVTVSSDIESLVADLVALAYRYDTYNVRTHAPLAITAEIKRQITALENTRYSENKITVEGI